jgi:hypothetical protein
LRDEIVWRLRTLPQQVGTYGLAGLVLGAAAIAAWGLYLAPKERELEQARNLAMARKDTAESSLAQLPPPPKSRPAQELLYSQAEFQSAVERFIELANQHGLVVAQGAYKLDAEQGSDLNRALLNFPAQGSYAKLRAFLDEAHTLQGVRLQTLQINRIASSDTELAIQIQFSMLLRK